MTARIWLPTQELINALPGTESDLILEGMGARSRQFGITWGGMAAILADRRTTLLEPCGPAR